MLVAHTNSVNAGAPVRCVPHPPSGPSRASRSSEFGWFTTSVFPLKTIAAGVVFRDLLPRRFFSFQPDLFAPCASDSATSPRMSSVQLNERVTAFFHDR
jgi:hypothetical protein